MLKIIEIIDILVDDIRIDSVTFIYFVLLTVDLRQVPARWSPSGAGTDVLSRK